MIMLVVCNLVWHDVAILYIYFVLLALCLEILIAKIAESECGVTKIPIHSVTSYVFREELFFFLTEGGGVGFMSVCSCLILKFRV